MVNQKRGRRFLKRLGFFLLFIAGCFGIAAFAMTLAFRDQQNNSLNALAREASFNNSQSQLQINALQSQVVELTMNQGNETLLYNGTFIWGIGYNSFGFSTPPFEECFYGQTASDITIVVPGTGYRVDDLITPKTVAMNPLAAQFYIHPVLRVTQVDGVGAVLAYDTLFTGCLAPGVTTSTYQTISVVGTGVTVQITGGSVPIPSNYYDYPSPPRLLVSPLQVSRYEVRSLQLESATWTILYLFPPEFPMLISVAPPFTAVNRVRISAYETYFNVPELIASTYFDNGFEVTALTQHNYEALNFTDSSNCISAGTCVQEALASDFSFPHAVQILSQTNVAPPLFELRTESFVSFSYTSKVPMLDFSTNGATFSLNRPLMLVLKTI